MPEAYLWCYVRFFQRREAAGGAKAAEKGVQPKIRGHSLTDWTENQSVTYVGEMDPIICS